MNLEFQSGPLSQINHRVAMLFATKDGKTLQADAAADALLAPFVATGEFGPSLGGTVYLVDPQGFQASRMLFVNVGKTIKKANDLRKAAARAWRALAAKGFDQLLISLDGMNDAEARAAFEGIVFADHKYHLRTETQDDPKRLLTLTLHSNSDRASLVQEWHVIAQAVCRARDLSQMPANILTPVHMGNLVKEWAAEAGWSVTLLGQKELEEEEMRTMLAVAQGSANEPRLIVIDYTPATPSGRTIALVGKAVTFDSGGLNIKTANMDEMKGDMGGGAAVIGILSTLRKLNYPHRVVGVIPAVENSVSGTATRPSDVVTSKAGLTVEINNTDAEGRLILVDAITFARRFNPDFLIDFATLTGACMVALGPKIYGVLGTHQPLIDAIVKAGWELHEPFWQLPLFDDYKELIKSSIADISNMPSTRYGAAISAGLFIGRFAEGLKWAHCDIAAAILEKPDDTSSTGGNGAGVRMMVEVLKNIEALG